MSFRNHYVALQTKTPLFAKIAFIFGVSMLLQLTLLYSNNSVGTVGKHIFNDSITYYRSAVNLANGDGYVNKQGEEPYFFREPGTSYFYAASVLLYKTVTGRSVVEPSFDNSHWPKDRDNQNVIQLIRLTQIILQALALVFLYLLLRHCFTDVFAFIATVIVALYPPLAFFSENLLRENLLFGVLMAMSYTFSSYIKKAAYWKLAIIGILWGVSALTLQVYMLLGIFLFPFVFIKTKQIILTAKRCAMISLFFILTVSPWLVKVYSFYPDIRIAKSMGCALTFDWGKLNGSLLYAQSHLQEPLANDTSDADKLLDTNAYSYTTTELFDLTFNGDFNSMAQKLKIGYGAPSRMAKIKGNIAKLGRFILLPGYIPGYGAFMGEQDYRNSALVIFISLFVGACSIFGLCVSIGKTFYQLPVYLFHLMGFWILMSESRRALPILPFCVLLGIIGFIKFIQIGFPKYRFSVYKNRQHKFTSE